MSGNAAAIDAVVSHHLDGFRSGVARFNELLAERLGVPFVGLGELGGAAPERPLLSFKVRELDAGAGEAVEGWLPSAGSWDVFLHEYAGLPLEERLVRGAKRVLCGNLEIEQAVRPLNGQVRTLWTPGLILDDRPLPQVELSVFTFGMAHKLRIARFRELRSLLERSGRTWSLLVSAANHETATLRDAEDIFSELHEVFPNELFFLGNLSDVAVVHELRRATFFAAFFDGGVRANNTSVASAIERGAVVLTNLDEHSPREFVHGENLLDVGRLDALPLDPADLARISAAAAVTARGRGWDALVAALRPDG
jgi:hypothetical protein